MSFKKALLVNVPMLIGVLAILYYFYSGNCYFGIWWEYTRPTKSFLLVSYPLLLLQILLWNKYSFPWKNNILGWLSVFFISFYFSLETNLLNILKTPALFLVSLGLVGISIPLLALQTLIWIFLLFRHLFLRVS